jgi:hypothetical protein
MTKLATSAPFGRFFVHPLSLALFISCVGKQPCDYSNISHVQMPNARIPHVASITTDGPCMVAANPEPCGNDNCYYTAGDSSAYVVVGSAIGTCTLTVAFSDGAPSEVAKVIFLDGPFLYCCEDLCTRTRVVQSSVPN